MSEESQKKSKSALDLNIEQGLKKGYFKLHNEGKQIEYVAQDKKYRFTDPEEQVRAAYYFDLIEKYKYKPEAIDFEVQMPSRVPQYLADIVVYKDADKKVPYITIECKKDGISDAEFEQATKQAIGNARVLKAEFAVCVAGNTERVMETDRWNDKEPDKATISDIPVSYGKVEEWRFKKEVENWDLKPVEKQELKRALEKSHDTLWSGGKRNPTVAFDELCKIIFVKIRDEKKPRKAGDPYDFQIKTYEKAKSVYDRINSIYQKARERDPEIFTEDLKIEPAELYTVVEHLQSLSLSKTDLDTKGVAFESFMTDFFKGKNGQFFTPREIVEFAIQMMKIGNEDLVLDPACGSGGFLLYALDQIRKQADEFHPNDETENFRYWHDFAQNKLFGIEINDSIARVAKMNMIIHDDGHTNVIGCDALEDIKNMHGKNQGFNPDHFDLIITNPPFGASVRQSVNPYLHTFKLGRNGAKDRANQKTEILFIERCLEFLKPETGRMAIILPDGVLTNSSLQYVRDFIMEHSQILAVVSLPQFAFAHYGAGVKSSLLFLRKKGKDEKLAKYPIFMGIAERVGYDATGRKIKENDLKEILVKWGEWKKENNM